MQTLSQSVDTLISFLPRKAMETVFLKNDLFLGLDNVLNFWIESLKLEIGRRGKMEALLDQY